MAEELDHPAIISCWFHRHTGDHLPRFMLEPKVGDYMRSFCVENAPENPMRPYVIGSISEVDDRLHVVYLSKQSEAGQRALRSMD